MIKESKKISRELNNILIDRIRKYQAQDVTQLLNSPIDEDSNNSYLGGLINFVGDDTNNLDDEINNFLDKISIDEIYIESLPDNEYKKEQEETDNKGIKILNEKKEENNENENKEKKEEINNEKNDLNINIFTENNKPENSIRILLAENYNNYFDIISNQYEKYDNNHFPKIIITDNKDNPKKVMLNNLRNKIFYSAEGQKIIINDEIYTSSLAYLKNKKIYENIPSMFKKNNKEFSLDLELLDESIENIQKKNMEFIEINKSVSTSMSKISSFCSQLDIYIKNKLEPFNTSINTSYQKIFKKKQKISEIKEITMKNSGNIILKRLKMNNVLKVIKKLRVYTKLKNNMNNLEELISDPKNYQKTLDLINKCKNDIEILKQKNNNNITDPIIEIFQNKLVEYKNENDGYMSGELSQVLNNYFGNFLLIDYDINEKNYKLYESYNISKFVLEKISLYPKKYNDIMTSLIISDAKEELEKMSDICDYYIKSNLINNLYTQLRGIFLTLTEKTMNNIMSIINEELIKEEEIKEEKEKKEEYTDINIQNEICILLCLLVSKNKFKEILFEFIGILYKKLENNENIDEKIINEINYIKLLVQKNINNKFLDQIKKCLGTISSFNNLDIYINNFYLVLEMLRDEIPNYENEKKEENIEQTEKEENNNINELHNIIIEEQKRFIENINR